MILRAHRPILLFLVVLCCGGISQAQNPETGLYRSFFGEESSSWNGVTEYYDIFPENQWMRTDGDTVVDGVIYKRVQFRYGRFILREDRSAGKLWCRYLDEDTEFVVADLSLSLNDTISLLNKNNPYVILPESVLYQVIDTSATEYGRTIILRSTRPFTRIIKFIEGIGGTNLFDCIKRPALTSQVICYHKDGELVYHESYKDYPEEDCKLIGMGLDDVGENMAIRIWPNPCGDWLNVGYDGVCEVTVTDLYGRVAMSVVVDNGRMDVSGLKKGCYSVRIEANGKSYVKKIVKV